MRKRWIVAAGAVVVLFSLAYLGSPYLAVRDFVAMAKKGDTEGLAASVDFPAVRASLKPQLTAAVAARVARDPEMRGNPLAGLGEILMPTILDRIVDSVVTPRGIATFVRMGRVGRDDAGNATPPPVDYDYGYVAIDRFRVTVKGKDDRGEPAGLMFERRGLFAWKLVQVEIPQRTLTDSDPAATPSI
jgi:hypothetical protein